MLSSGLEICHGPIPDLRNASSIRYDIHGKSSGSLIVGISPENSNDMKHSWIGRVERTTVETLTYEKHRKKEVWMLP